MIIENVRTSFMVPSKGAEETGPCHTLFKVAESHSPESSGARVPFWHRRQPRAIPGTAGLACPLVHLDAADPVVGHVLAAAAVGDVHHRPIGLDAEPLEAVELRREPVVVVDV